MISIDKDYSGPGCRLVLSPNRSIRWRDLMIFYVFTSGVALAIGLFFLLQGVWMILPFSGLEVMVLGICLYITSKRLYRREIITLSSAKTRIEKGSKQAEQSWEFDTSWIRLRDEKTGGFNRRRKLALGSHGKYVEIGGFLDNFEKDELAFQLKDCIIRGDFSVLPRRE
ncbi:MAG: DUF2244 domain-containing protein [Pseudomonadota bacterium]